MPAVLAIVAREGFEGATIRRVAAEAGCSAGAVQKRFPSRSRLLRSACEHVVEVSLARIETTPVSDGATLFERQRLAASETLPLDAERRSEGLVWTSYLLRAAVDETLADLPRHLDLEIHNALTHELTDAQASGSLLTNTDPQALADALLALVDGIALRMLYTPTGEHPKLLASLDVGLHALLPSP